jgi:predicted AlkP superfamily pyrophosphatase or phosphodiesterase
MRIHLANSLAHRRLFAGLALLPCLAAAPATAADADIRLVLQITVDGLRGDLLERYRAGFRDGGFNALMEQGVVFSNAHFQHANTETIVGHATLATGASPSLHGMVGNVWFDRDAGELAYNIEDPDSPLLPSRGDAAEGAQVDPAQKRSRTQGRSPRVLLAPTIGDTLAAYHGGRSKVFGVAGKDRSAVAMAGKAGKVGKAFWFSTNTGDFVTSRYYYADWFLFEKGPIKVMQGSPWRYDTHVPIVFAGPGIEARQVHRLVHPVDVAPTIAALLGMSPPASAQGSVLPEVSQSRPIQ